MLMNQLDIFLQKNNLYRAYRQNLIETVIRKYYLEHIGEVIDQHVLEIGCGSGIGTQSIRKFFTPKEIIATDLDPILIEEAKRRVIDPSIHFEVADATKLRFANNNFAAIFDFGVIHHIPDWKNCLKELQRVLKKGGILFIFDVSIESFDGLWGTITRIFTSHPYESMYQKIDFTNFLKKLNLRIISENVHKTTLNYFVLIVSKEK